MSGLEIAIVVVVAVAFVAVVGTMLYKKLTHKGGGCSCGCEGCSAACPHCQTARKPKTTNKPDAKN
jgi:hypothetical protein